MGLLDLWVGLLGALMDLLPLCLYFPYYVLP